MSSPISIFEWEARAICLQHYTGDMGFPRCQPAPRPAATKATVTRKVHTDPFPPERFYNVRLFIDSQLIGTINDYDIDEQYHYRYIEVYYCQPHTLWRRTFGDPKCPGHYVKDHACGVYARPNIRRDVRQAIFYLRWYASTGRVLTYEPRLIFQGWQ